MSLPHSWLRFGESFERQVIVVEPLFEEANRCRKLIATIMRLLAMRQIGSALADLPGTGESLTDISSVKLGDWRGAVQAFNPTLIAAFRGGALLDGSASGGVWRFSPESGARIVRDLKRASLTSSDATLYAGHALSDALLAEIEAATPPPVRDVRTVRLASDALDADLKLEGSPLWRRAEPGDDAKLAQALANDIAEWVGRCAA